MFSGDPAQRSGMARRGTVFILAFLAVSAAVRADTADLPYRIGGDGRVSTDVFVNGEGPFSFLLDTASSRTMLFDHLRQRLKLEPSAPERLKVYAMNNIGTALPVQPRELRLGDRHLTGLTLGVLPDETHGPDGELAADGILGLDARAIDLLVLEFESLRLFLLVPAARGFEAYRVWPSSALIPYRG